jgi:hypothetical protein
MRRIIYLIMGLLLAGSLCLNAQTTKKSKTSSKKSTSLSKVVTGVTNALTTTTTSDTVTSTGVTKTEASSGIKEALNKGITKAVEIVSKENGYYKDDSIKIEFPSQVKVIEDKLRSLGMEEQIENVVLTFNRAAEDAASQATAIFVAAIKEMTVNDAIGIVKGKDDAATQYLKEKTSAQLREKFSPMIKTSLNKVNATKTWNKLMSKYNSIPMVKKYNFDLTSYVTGKAIDGLFVKVAEEEKKIRTNPAERTTELLKKVFGI